MRPEGYPSCVSCEGKEEEPLQNLPDEPEKKVEKGRYLHNGEKHKEEDNGGNTSEREEDEIGSHNCRYRSTCPHNWHLGEGRYYQLDDIRYNPSPNIKKQEFEMPQPILYIVPEYPKEKHIPQYVKPSPVKEKGCEKCKEKGKSGNYIGSKKACGNHPTGIKKPYLLLPREGDLVEENEEVQRDKKNSDYWISPGRDIISNRNQIPSPFSVSLARYSLAIRQ